MMASMSDSPKAIKSKERSLSLAKSGSPKTFRFLGWGKRDTLTELHHPQDEKALTKLLQYDNEDIKIEISEHINSRQAHFSHCAPIHSIVKNKKGRERFECLMSLLIHSNADVNLQTNADPKVSALHLLTKASGDDKDKDGLLAVKALLAFGAKTNELNGQEQTPLDVACESEKYDLVVLLQELGALSSAASKRHLYTLQRLPPFHERSSDFTNSCDSAADTPASYSLAARVEINLEERSQQDTFTASVAVHMAEQTKELYSYKRELALSPMTFNVEGGSRVLFLDGGGMRGLAQIEFLVQLEQATGRRITELFNWIVGTSTGALIALGLVYAKLTLPQLRQLYFKMKRVFSSPHFYNLAGGNSKELEKLLQDIFGSTKMTDIHHPKVLITAVNKERTPLRLSFFNNCFDDEYKYPISDKPVWEVARCTTAAPMHFDECDDHVDGGVLANNPCEAGLAAIRDFYHERHGKRLSIAFVVSVGSGRWQGEKIGSADFHQYLGPGGLLTLRKSFKAGKNVLLLLEEAMVESEIAAENCKSWCRELGIPFYRFCTRFPGKVDTAEKDNAKLVDMIIETKRYLLTTECLEMFDELVQVFHHVVQKNTEARAMKQFLQSTVNPSDVDPALKSKS